MLLHHVLDDDVDNERKESKTDNPSRRHEPLLPSVISFLQASLPIKVFLDIVVQCTRKTELRSWRTLFNHLPPPKDLFEQALRLNSLKTAVGYLLVLQAMEDEGEGGHEAPIEDYVVRLIGLASQNSDWELCGELARFLIALDASGDMLRRAISRVGLRNAVQSGGGLTSNGSGITSKGLGLDIYSPPWPTLSPTSSVSPHSRQQISPDDQGSPVDSTTDDQSTFSAISH